MYVDDTVSGGSILNDVEVIKQNSIEPFAKRGSNSHKWHLNMSSLEKSNINNNHEITYAKQSFQNNTSNTKSLSLGWNKASDTLFFIIPTYHENGITKQNMLSYVTSTYDLLGLISLSHVIDKVMYRELCDEKVPWEAEVSVDLKRKLKNG